MVMVFCIPEVCIEYMKNKIFISKLSFYLSAVIFKLDCFMLKFKTTHRIFMFEEFKHYVGALGKPDEIHIDR